MTITEVTLSVFYCIVKKLKLTDFETISFHYSTKHQWSVGKFLIIIKSPSTKDSEYLAKLKDFILTLDAAEPIFGDLNIDLRCDKGIGLKNFNKLIKVSF